MLTRCRRNLSGSALAELAPALWIVFVVFTTPLTMYGSWGIRYCLLANAVQAAASAGSQCKSFSTNISSSDLSATNTANQSIQNAITSGSGITINQIHTYIIIHSLSGSTTTKQSVQLAQPANTTLNSYNFEVSIQAQVPPFWTGSSKYFGNIPGLTSPLVTTVRADSFFENTQGLTQ